MSRTREFVIAFEVNPVMLRDDEPLTRLLVKEKLDRMAQKPMRGPRGGRYEAIAPPHWYGDSADATPGWFRGRHTFAARVKARYVRPT